VIAAGDVSTAAMYGSTEDEQFFDEQRRAKLAAV
jgi:hypothetical protein